ncbi:MAG: glutamate synthase subunit alpha [Elusimicrobia bacterium RIFCSPLOWO2_01_FULL_59_12]|nr:MAG: glutamate synthase subunit alpha [Elusimicrobia bacterium RIFCSPLOWO2_01_FULL_59_12]
MNGYPPKQGLYDPFYEKDACGVGFVVDIQGRKSHKIIQQGLTALDNLRHRGACGCEENTGDGAGILIQAPHAFLSKSAKEAGFSLPPPGEYGVGMAFLPKDPADQKECQKRLETIVQEEGQKFLGWRTVPTHNAGLGASAVASEPVVRQFFIGRSSKLQDDAAFERKLYVIRKRAEAAIRYSAWKGGYRFYISSLSYKTIVYKGMLISNQVPEYFPDLRDPSMESAIAMVHSRFSTNTFPSWDRAHPYRYLAHNGEINTLRGNVNWMFTRQALFASDVFGDDLKKITPVLRMDGSDSAIFDNVLEFLVLSGRSMAHAMMMMIPEPWQNHEMMSEEKKAFYEYHSCLMEPWDGPASIAFTDGVQMGAILDRNGLRPSRYYVTRDGLVVMASEVGVLDIPPEQILHKGRLQPGRMFLIDTAQKRIVADEEIKHKICSERPYRLWLNENLVHLEDLAEPPVVPEPDHPTMLLRQQAFGYTFEDLRILMAPMAENAIEATGSMGDDTPLAVLSDKPRLLYDYFKQLFAQVTNPPIDAIREEIVTGTATSIGPEGNLLDARPESARQIQLKSPILTDEEFYKLVHVKHPWFRSRVFPMVFPVLSGGKGLESALDKLFSDIDRTIEEGVNIIILSDRMMDRGHAAIPALLACAGLHHHLIRRGTRTRVGIILESGEPREIHHFALLIGYGIGAINPYLALETLDDMIRQGMLTTVDHAKAVRNYVKSAAKGVLKVTSKMGISTLQSYSGAQIFEAIGLNDDVIDKYFCWTPSRIGGVGLDVIAEEVRMRHHRAFPDYGNPDGRTLEEGGKYQWRKEGENHLFNPESIHYLQTACRTHDYPLFKKYSDLINDQSNRLGTLRGLMEFKDAQPIPIEEVEPAEAIMKRFKSGAMSYGSISKEAHEGLAIAMNRIGGRSNTGEGGEDPARYTPEPNGDSKNSAIKQVASGRFGVTSYYLTMAQELQIKMAQGAKPGEGGQLPGRKVYPWIAKVRHSTPGVGLISPPPHHDIYSIEDLAELIHDLKNANHAARINVKLVSEVGVGTIAAGVAKGHADVVLISGHDGGTGASPQTSIKHAGLPWELGLAETHQTLVLNNLRDRIVVETDGQLKTGRDVAIATLLGAEEFGFATAPLVALGCIMMRVCHLDTCPVGVATQNPELRKKFTGDPAHVVNFMRFIAQDLREIMARLGFRTINEMVGRVDKLQMKKAVSHWKAKGLDLSKILYAPQMGPEVGRYQKVAQNHGLDQALDRTDLFAICKPAIERGEKVKKTLPIKNIHRVVGTMVGSEITRRHGPEGLKEDTLHLHFQGSAGQSFGAFVPHGMTLELEGDSNDYFGKGLSGGKIIVYPPKKSTFVPEENILIGNVAFYGATSGEAYIRGVAGERFCVRNSGVWTVVEGVGDHACEYMTGGRVVVLGKTGRNFAAGMSGGVAYVLDKEGTFPIHLNKQMVELTRLEDAEEIAEIKKLIERHAQYTGSTVAQNVLDNWSSILPKFIKVLPKDYKRVLEAEKRVRAQGLSGEEATMAAFQENIKDLSRVSGN